MFLLCMYNIFKKTFNSNKALVIVRCKVNRLRHVCLHCVNILIIWQRDWRTRLMFHTVCFSLGTTNHTYETLKPSYTFSILQNWLFTGNRVLPLIFFLPISLPWHAFAIAVASTDQYYLFMKVMFSSLSSSFDFTNLICHHSNLGYCIW